MTAAPPSPKADRSARKPSAWRKLWSRIRGGKLTRPRLAASVAVGLLVGCLPLYGFHFPLCLAVCLPLRLDLLTAYLAANISNPFFAPFLLTAEVQVGSLLMGDGWISLERAPESLSELSHLTAPLVLGSLVFGVCVASVGAFLAYRFGPEPEAKELVWSDALDRTIARYRAVPRRHRFYVELKLRTDPIVEACTELPDLGAVLDVGCGRGQLGLFLLELGTARELCGFDWDEDKLNAARSAAGRVASFMNADAADESAQWPPADTLLLIDVLHYLSPEEQKRLLERAARHLPPGGRLLVRDTDAARWQSRLASFAERCGVRLGMNRGKTLVFRRTADLTERLSALGFVFRIQDAGRGLGNVLVIAERQLGATAATAVSD